MSLSLIDEMYKSLRENGNALAINDLLYRSLKDLGYEGNLNEMLFLYLKGKGYEGSINDMLSKEGGFSSLRVTPKIAGILKGDGAAFDMLDTSKMYKDVEGTQPATEVGDTVRRVDSHVEGIYLYDDFNNGGVLEDFNGRKVLRFRGTHFRVNGFNPAVPKPVVAHGTMKATNGVLYWYNRPGSGYGPRKWGVLVRDTQYRTFYNNGNITVVGVPEWNTYHDVYLNRVGNQVAIDGEFQAFPNTSPESYTADDGGFTIGSYSGSTSDVYTGIITYFLLSGTPMDEEKLIEFSNSQREFLGLESLNVAQ